jgi:hypothetical protein
MEPRYNKRLKAVHIIDSLASAVYCTFYERFPDGYLIDAT